LAAREASVLVFAQWGKRLLLNRSHQMTFPCVEIYKGIGLALSTLIFSWNVPNSRKLDRMIPLLLAQLKLIKMTRGFLKGHRGLKLTKQRNHRRHILGEKREQQVRR
jgi:hypothetical protein